MPTYDYKCLVCENRFEFFQKMLDNPLTVCKKCGGELKRLIGPGAGPIFKGSGFYQTDYKSNARGNGTVPSAQKNKTKTNSTPEVKSSSVKEKKAS